MNKPVIKIENLTVDYITEENPIKAVHFPCHIQYFNSELHITLATQYLQIKVKRIIPLTQKTVPRLHQNLTLLDGVLLHLMFLLLVAILQTSQLQLINELFHFPFHTLSTTQVFIDRSIFEQCLTQVEWCTAQHSSSRG